VLKLVSNNVEFISVVTIKEAIDKVQRELEKEGHPVRIFAETLIDELKLK